jgi:signal transduction histidine kinase
MPQELREVMLSTALNDAERMRKLVQDFLTLSQLESGTIEWNSEPLSLTECVALSLSHIYAHHNRKDLAQIH